MKDENKTKAQLIGELLELRQRVAELKEVEGESVRRNRHELRQKVRHRLRDQVSRMQSSDDIQNVLSVLKEGLHELEIPFQDCGINLVDPHRDPAVVSLNSLGREGEWMPPEQAWGQDLVFQFWQAGVPVYRRDLQAEDIYDEHRCYLEYFGHPVRCVLDVPFAYGTLAVNSAEPDAFSQEDIMDLEQWAIILEEGFRRREDLRNLEQRNQELTREITERKQAERRLEDAEQRYRNLFEEAPVMYVLTSHQKTGPLITEVNVQFLRTLGYTHREVIEHPLADFYTAESKAQLLEEGYQQALEGRFVIQERQLVARDGRVIETLLHAVPEVDLGKKVVGTRAMFVDITERKQIEQELIHLERLRAVGELSAGVSHNLNNILTTVLGPAQLIKRQTDDPDLLSEIDTIIVSARRACDLVHELHLSVRTSKEKSLHPVSVDQAVQQAVQTTRPRWKDEPEARGVSIEVLTQGESVPLIQGTEAGLHDILTNLIFNAVDAMPEGGAITIETQEMGKNVQITFSDTGTGMNEETKRRIFEPFFTTKMDLGTGLGLLTVYNTVNRWGGTIEVDSTPGEGTAFTLRFPVWTEGEVEKEGEAAVWSTRSGKILVVDDDESICSLLLRLLEEPHEVEAVTDGRQALEWFAPGKYDVIMIDLGMSEMPGDQLMKQMKEIDPLVATVLITGWALPKIDPRVISFDFKIAKPFSDLDEIEAIVAQAVELHDQRAGKEN